MSDPDAMSRQIEAECSIEVAPAVAVRALGSDVVAIDDIPGMPGHFDGVLEVRPGRACTVLHLGGTYTPSRPPDLFGDGLLDHRLAQRALTHHLDRLARELLE